MESGAVLTIAVSVLMGPEAHVPSPNELPEGCCLNTSVYLLNCPTRAMLFSPIFILSADSSFLFASSLRSMLTYIIWAHSILWKAPLNSRTMIPAQ